MTNPQSQLETLSQRIWDLWQLFKPSCEEGEECPLDIFERIKLIEEQMADFLSSMQRQENLMNLIIKLLSKNDCSNTTID